MTEGAIEGLKRFPSRCSLPDPTAFDGSGSLEKFALDTSAGVTVTSSPYGFVYGGGHVLHARTPITCVWK